MSHPLDLPEIPETDLEKYGELVHMRTPLRYIVEGMRALGVVEWDGIVLGPPPPPPPVKLPPRTAYEQERISKAWREYRQAKSDAEIDGTALPDAPSEPETIES